MPAHPSFNEGTESGTATLLLPSLPPGALVGIDLLALSTPDHQQHTSSTSPSTSLTSTTSPRPRFRGISQLPAPGWHLAYASGTATASVRYGSWFYVAPGAVVVRRWEEGEERLVPGTVEADADVREGEDGLLAWRLRAPREGVQEEEDAGRREWEALTGWVSERVLRRIVGRESEGDSNGGFEVSSVSVGVDMDGEAVDDDDEEDKQGMAGLGAAAGLDGQRRVWGKIRADEEEKARKEQEKEKHNATARKKKEETTLHFLPIDLRRTWPAAATGRARTLAAQDRSWALDTLLAQHCADSENPQDILAELQFCFLNALALHNPACLAQWRRLVGLLLTCARAAARDRPGFFAAFLALLRCQLVHVADAEAGLFASAVLGEVDEVEGGAWLRGLLMRFRRGLEGVEGADADADGEGKGKKDVLGELEKLETWLRRTRGWELDPRALVRRGVLALEDGEVVEMDVPGFEAEDESGEYAPTVVELSAAQLRELGFAVEEGEGDKEGVEGVEGEMEQEEEEEEVDMRY